MARRERRLSVSSRGDHWCASFVAMGSPCELLVAADERRPVDALAERVATEAWRIEDKFSRYIDGNVVDRINRGAGHAIDVDEETAALLDFSQTLYDLSEHRFDITSGVLRETWQFDGSDNVPDAAAVARILDRVGWHRVRWERPRLVLEAGMQIDFGGVAKEYAVDRAAASVADEDFPCLVNFGGDLAVAGAPEDGWRVGVESPAGTLPAHTIRLSRGALATSGDARRFLLKDGRRYGHILDPTTGWPVVDAPRSVTVAADTCTQAGMLATLAMLRGDQAEAFLDEQSVQYWCRREADPPGRPDQAVP